jgi:hypothetical protein
MAIKTIKISANSPLITRRNISAIRPFTRAGYGLNGRFKTGVKYEGVSIASGDDLVLEFPGTTGITTADVKESNGSGLFSAKTFTIADLSGVSGHKITIANITQDILLNIEVEV